MVFSQKKQSRVRTCRCSERVAQAMSAFSYLCSLCQPVVKDKHGLSKGPGEKHVRLCCAHLIYELYGELVREVNGRVVRLKRDGDVSGLSRSNAALYWLHTEHTQTAEVLGPYKTRVVSQKSQMFIS